MIAMDRFQAIVYPMNNHLWQPTRSKQKILIAWMLSFLLCIPHALLFKATDSDGSTTCSARLTDQERDWGARIFVTWFTLSNFLVPLGALSFYYVKICGKIRRNLKAKKRMLPAATCHHHQTVKLSSGSSGSLVEVSTTIPDFACSAIRPRVHSLEGISRAKIRSVKQAVVVILGYIICSAPAIIVQLWKAWIRGEHHLGTSLL